MIKFSPAELMSVSQASHVLERSTATVRRYASEGRLPPVRTGAGITYYRQGDVEKLANDLRAEGETRGSAGKKRAAG
jgi:predicted site-specific integrase-resolvase